MPVACDCGTLGRINCGIYRMLLEDNLKRAKDNIILHVLWILLCDSSTFLGCFSIIVFFSSTLLFGNILSVELILSLICPVSYFVVYFFRLLDWIT